MTKRTLLLPAALAAYGLFFLGLTLLILPGDHPAPNLVPFRSIIRDWRTGGSAFVVNFLGNIGAFLPLGILIPMVFARLRNVAGVLAACMLFSAVVECLQYLSGRRVGDIDDVLLNGLGGVVGFLMLRSAGNPRVPREG